MRGTIRLVPIAFLFLATLSACSQSAASTTSTATSAAPTTSTSATAAPAIEEVIELEGSEALGLAVTNDAVWAITYQSGILSRIDPESGAVTLSEEIGSQPATLLAIGDEIWAAGYGGVTNSNIYRIDPDTGQIAESITTGEVCCDLTFGDGAIWAVNPDGEVLRVDPQSNQVSDRFEVSVDRNAHTNVVYAGESVWVSSDTTLLSRLDPASGFIDEFDVDGGVPFLEHEGLLWGASPDSLWAVDPQTGDVVSRIELEDSIEVISLGVSKSEIWTGIRRPGRVGAVLRIDPASGEVLDELRDIEIPARIAFGFGSAWITDSGSNRLYRISPAG